MATKRGGKSLNSYAINGTDLIIKVGDFVLMRPSDPTMLQHVARIEKIEVDPNKGAEVHILWYYRPEEAAGSRRVFHGRMELFVSDHQDRQSVYTIEGKCVVHSFENYIKLEAFSAVDFFCRFKYSPATGEITPDRVPVYCKCDLPYNPDLVMVQCDECKEWCHPKCIGMTLEEANQLDTLVCPDCSKSDTRSSASNAASSEANI